MKNALLTFAFLAAYMVCPAQHFMNGENSSGLLADIGNSSDKIQHLQYTIRTQQTQIHFLHEQIVSMKSFIAANTNFNALKYSIIDAQDFQRPGKKVLEYFVDAKADEAYIIIYNENNRILREYPLDLGMKSYLQINKKKLTEGQHTLKLFINGVDVCSRSL